ncbi:hypothetical protein [Clostridium sp. DL1XJH146]
MRFIIVILSIVSFNMIFVLLRAKKVYKKDNEKLDKPNLLKLKKYN